MVVPGRWEQRNEDRVQFRSKGSLDNEGMADLQQSAPSRPATRLLVSLVGRKVACQINLAPVSLALIYVLPREK
jgi:hypothetical protein